MRNRSLVALLCVAAAGGCHTGPRRVIVAIPITTADAVSVSEHAGLVHEAAANSLAIYWNGPGGEGNVSRQVDLAERAIQEDDYGIAISPAAPFALNTVIQNAVAAGVPVVVVGPRLTLVPGRNLSYVSSDLDRAGFLAAQRIAALLGGRGEVVIAGIDPTVPGLIETAHAFEASLATLAPGLKIVSRLVGSLTWGQSELAITRALREHPGVRAIYALDANDIRGAIGAVRARREASGLSIIGNTQTLDLVDELRQGSLDSLVIPNIRAMGVQAVRNLVAARNGSSVPGETRFDPAVLTRENVDTEPMQQWLNLDWRTQP